MSATKELKIKLGFQAEVESAMSKIQQLSKTLESIGNTTVSVKGGNIEAAVNSARELNTQILKATNADTGKLNFSQLQANLKATGQDLNTLSRNLLAMGPQGQKAFDQIASAVATAEVRIKKTNGILSKFATTLSNTIRWQMSTVLVDKFTGAVSNAIRYVEDLDRSLNDIRIVTGKGAGEMARFAKQANEAAKSLKTTTTEYTNASLIYFQQGLDTKEVIERTDATVKMAQVVGESVGKVSNQLTAIWNNFDNGTKSLEYYADVISALGAATASSTDEISAGLEKFAGIAETVGLSYEYATSALATVTSETRESAEVVGTAFKTLFARIQDLELGETLDDGTTLGSYSEALLKVGINIKDASGGLKDMNSILDEMGNKWNTLSQDSQVALAQSVAGVRQYTHLVTLMNNWDTMKENVDIAKNAEGTLEKQHEIYKTSLEALDDELKATAEDLYNDLLNPEMLADFKKILIEITGLFDRLVESAGGLKGLLNFGGLLLIQKVLPLLGGFMAKVKTNLSDMIGLTQKQQIKTIKTMADDSRAQAQALANKSGTSSKSSEASTTMDLQINKVRETRNSIDQKSAALSADILDHKARLLSLDKVLTDKQKQQYQSYIDSLEAQKASLNEAKDRLLVEQEILKTANESAQARVTGAITKEEEDKVLEEERKKYIENAKKDRDEDRAAVENFSDFDEAEARKREEEAKKNIEDKKASAQSKLKTAEEDVAKLDTDIYDLSHKKDRTKEEELELNQKRRERSSKLQETKGLSKEVDKYDAELENAYSESAITGRVKKQREAADKKYRESHKVLTDEEIEAKARENVVLTDDMRAKAAKKVAARKGGVDSSVLQGVAANLTNGDAQVEAVTQQVMKDVGMLDDGKVKGDYSSIANLNKLGEKRAELKRDASITDDLSTEVGIMSTNVAKKKQAASEAEKSSKKGKNKKASSNLKEEKETTQELEKREKIQKKIGDQVAKYKTGWEEILATMKKEGKELGNIEKAITELDQESAKVDLSGLSEEELATLGQALTRLRNQITEADSATGEFSEGVKADILNATDKVSPQTLDQIAQGAESTATTVGELGEKTEEFRKKMEEPPYEDGAMEKFKKSATEATTALTNGLMGVQTATTGLNMIMDENGTVIDKISGGMMVLNGITTTFSALQSIATVVTAIATKTKKKEDKQNKENTVSIWALAAAKLKEAVTTTYAAEAHKGAIGIGIASAAVAGILATCAIVSATNTMKETRALEKKTKELKNNTAEAKKNSEASQEEYEKTKELAESYNDIYKIYKETGKEKKNLTDKAIEVVDALGIENGAVLALTGQYGELNEKIREKLKLTAEENTKEKTKVVEETVQEFIIAANSSNNGLSYSTTEDGSIVIGFDIGDSGEDEFIGKYLDTIKPEKYSNIEFSGQGIAQIVSSPEEAIAYMTQYEELVRDAIEWASENGINLKESEEFKNFQKYLDSDVKTIVGDYDNAKNDELSAKIVETSIDTGIAEVTNLQDYDKAYVNFISELNKKGIDTDSEQGKKAINDFINNNGLGIFKAQKEIVDKVEAKTGLNGKIFDLSGSETEGTLAYWAKSKGISIDSAIAALAELERNGNLGSIKTSEDLFGRLDTYVQSGKAVDAITKSEKYSEARSDLASIKDEKGWSEFEAKYKASLFDPKSALYIGMDFDEFKNLKATDRQQKLSTQTVTQGFQDKEKAYEQELKDQQESEAKQKANEKTIDELDKWIEEQEKIEQKKKEEGMGEGIKTLQNSGQTPQFDLTGQLVTHEAGKKTLSVDPNNVSKSNKKEEKTIEINGESYTLEEAKELRDRLEAENKDNNQNTGRTAEDIQKDLDETRQQIENQRNQSLIDQAAALGVTEEAYSIYVAGIMEQNKAMTEEQAKLYAITQLQLDEGVKSLSEVWEEYGYVLADSTKKHLPAYGQGLEKVKENLSKLTGIDISLITDEIALAAVESKDLEAAAKGDYKALLRLKNMDFVIKTKYRLDLKDSENKEIKDLITTDERYINLKIGAEVEEQWLEDLIKKLTSKGLDQFEIKAFVNDLGVNAKYATPQVWSGDIDGDKKIDYYVNYYLDENGKPIKRESTQYNSIAEAKANQSLVAIGGSFQGLDSTSTYKEPIRGKDYLVNERDWKDKVKKLDEEVDKFFALNQQLEKQNKLLKDIDNQMSKTYGQSKIALLNKSIKAQADSLEIEKNLLAARETASEDAKTKLLKFSTDDNNILIDEATGEIKNYNEFYTQWLIDYNNSIKEQQTEQQRILNLQKDLAEYQRDNPSNQKEIDIRENLIKDAEEDLRNKEYDNQKLFEERTKALQNYITALDNEDKQVEAIIAAENKLIESRYEAIFALVDLNLQLNESNKQLLDYQLQKLGEGFYESSERLALEMSNNSKGPEFYQDLDEALAELKEKYGKGEIDQAKFTEGIQKIQTEAINAGISLMELRDKIFGYYGEALEAGMDEISSLVDEFETIASKLDHYDNVLSLLGLDQDYELQNKLIDRRMENAQSQKEIAETVLKELNEEKKRIEEDLQAEGLNEESKKQLEEDLKTVNGFIAEQQEAIYGYIEELGEAALEKLQNSLEKIKRELEKDLTGGSSFDYILDSMDRLEKLQDLYLTDTNKIYETTTLINKANADMNKTSNVQAKQRYAEYQKYIQQLQKSENLSKYDLDIAKAKYETLQAQIALEEARNAKDQVRLTRDAEGNFGYVYTANEDKIADAEQKILDAQNKEYNISLEASKEYARLSVEALQEGTEAMAELWNQYYVEHSITEEEFLQRSKETQEYYQNLSQDAAKLARAADINLATSTYSHLSIEDGKYYDGLSGKANLTQISVEKSLSGIKTALTGVSEDAAKILNSEMPEGMPFIFSKFDSLVEQYFAYGSDTTGSASQNFLDFSSAVTKALGSREDGTGVAGAFKVWEDSMRQVFGENFNSADGDNYVSKNLEEVSTSTENLKDKIIGEDGNGGLVKGIMDEVEAIQNSTSNWYLEYKAVDDMIAKYGELAQTLQTLQEAMGGKGKMDWSEQIHKYLTKNPDAINDWENDPTIQYYLRQRQSALDANEEEAKAKGWATNENLMIDLEKEFGRTKWPKESKDQNEQEKTKEQNKQEEVKEPEKQNKTKEQVKKLLYDIWYDGHADDLIKNVGNNGWMDEAEQYYGKEAATKVREAFQKGGGTYSGALKWLEAQQFNTGGYTGSWGPEGKWAMLHEKEIVLNKQDTSNLLQAITMLREISNIIDRQAMYQSLSLLDSRMFDVFTERDNKLQQEVTIHAEFPNVNDHNEIEIALNDLITRASQYANRF